MTHDKFPKIPRFPVFQINAKKVILGTKFKRCVQHHELRATDCYFLGGFVQSNLSKPCAIPKLPLRGPRRGCVNLPYLAGTKKRPVKGLMNLSHPVNRNALALDGD